MFKKTSINLPENPNLFYKCNGYRYEEHKRRLELLTQNREIQALKMFIKRHPLNKLNTVTIGTQTNLNTTSQTQTDLKASPSQSSTSQSSQSSQSQTDLNASPSQTIQTQTDLKASPSQSSQINANFNAAPSQSSQSSETPISSQVEINELLNQVEMFLNDYQTPLINEINSTGLSRNELIINSELDTIVNDTMELFLNILENQNPEIKKEFKNIEIQTKVESDNNTELINSLSEFFNTNKKEFTNAYVQTVNEVSNLILPNKNVSENAKLAMTDVLKQLKEVIQMTENDQNIRILSDNWDTNNNFRSEFARNADAVIRERLINDKSFKSDESNTAISSKSEGVLQQEMRFTGELANLKKQINIIYNVFKVPKSERTNLNKLTSKSANDLFYELQNKYSNMSIPVDTPKDELKKMRKEEKLANLWNLQIQKYENNELKKMKNELKKMDFEDSLAKKKEFETKSKKFNSRSKMSEEDIRSFLNQDTLAKQSELNNLYAKLKIPKSNRIIPSDKKEIINQISILKNLFKNKLKRK